jgi:hypothetical protein
MSHKGYTLNYFINYFQSIPVSQWCVSGSQVGTRHDAVGHALRNVRTTLAKTKNENTNRLNALEHFLGSSIVSINDNTRGSFTKFGKTPRGRILRALRNRKRTGNIQGVQVTNSN